MSREEEGGGEWGQQEQLQLHMYAGDSAMKRKCTSYRYMYMYIVHSSCASPSAEGMC